MQQLIRRVSVPTRLGLTFSLLLIVSLTAVVVSVSKLASLNSATQQMSREAIRTERLVSDWYRNVHTGVRRTAAIARSSDLSLQGFFAEDQAASTKSSGDLQKSVESLMSTPAEKTIFSEIVSTRKAYLGIRDSIDALKKEGKLEEANRVLNDKFTPAGKQYLAKLEELMGFQRNEIDSIAQRIDEQNSNARAQLVALAGTSGFLSLVFAWVLSLTITRPLSQAETVAERIAQSDLSSRGLEPGDDEFGRLLRCLERMRANLANVVAHVRQGAEGVASASAEIAQGNMNLSHRTENQAAVLEQTSSSMEQLSATVQQNAENAQNADRLAQRASDVAAKGGEVVGQAVQTMKGIVSSSRKIADITQVIDSIAFQTNILALNAAVEAARAGEQGRGFAVVASEVRGLAQRSAEAAREIKQLINDSVSRVEQGTALVDRAGATMTEVVEAISNVTTIMGEISGASGEQARGLAVIVEAVTQLDQTTQQNASLVEEIASASVGLNDQVKDLVDAVAAFRLPVQGQLLVLP